MGFYRWGKSKVHFWLHAPGGIIADLPVEIRLANRGRLLENKGLAPYVEARREIRYECPRGNCFCISSHWDLGFGPMGSTLDGGVTRSMVWKRSLYCSNFLRGLACRLPCSAFFH